MILHSTIPADHSPAVRLREYLALVREMSLARDPHQLLQSYRARSRFVVQADQFFSLSRRDLPPGKVRITRSTRWSEAVDPWKEKEKLPLIEGGMIWELMRAGQPVKIDRLEVDADDPIAPYVEGMQSALAVPIFYEGEPLYMVVLLRAEAEAFTLDELATVLLTSNLIGRATSHLVLAEELRAAYAALDRQFHLVGEIQRGLLPHRLPEIPGVKIATYYETSARAGGDYYDFFELENGQWGFIIADVSGHGPPAAVVMAIMHALLKTPRSACPEAVQSPAGLLRFLNGELMTSLSSGQFVTAFVGVYDQHERRLTYASAGHNPPRWLRARDGAVVPLDSADGLPLALVSEFACSDHEVVLERGDRLLLYTDGITETFNERREMFGTEGLDEAMQRCSRTPESMVECLLADVRRHARDAPPEDDRTVVAIAFD